MLQIKGKQERQDWRLSSFVVIYYFIDALNLTIKSIFPLSPQIWVAMSNIFMIFLALLMISSIKIILDRSLVPFLVVELIVLIMFLLSAMMGFSERSLLLDKGFRTLAVSVPLMFYVISVENKAIFYTLITKASYVLIIMLSFVFIANVHEEYFYTMSVSYAMLIPALLQINEFINQKKILNLVFSIIAVAGIAIFGARGPLLGIGAYFIFRYYSSKRLFIEKFIVFSFMFGIMFIILRYSENIGRFFVRVLQKRDIYSRTLNSLANGTMLQTSGRDILWTYYLDLIKQKPIFGWGVYGGWIAEGSGPHNMIIALLLAFGPFLGGLFTLISIGLILSIFFVKDHRIRQLILVYGASNINLFFVSEGFFNVNWLVFIGLVLLGHYQGNQLYHSNGVAHLGIKTQGA